MDLMNSPTTPTNFFTSAKRRAPSLLLAESDDVLGRQIE